VGAMLIAFFYGELTQRGTLRFKSLAVSGLTVLVSAILTLVSGNADAVNLSLSQLWTNGALGQGGGVIGGLLGILFALALTPAFAVFICTVCVLALASFTFGKTRLGIWSRIFGGAEPKKEAKKEAPAPAPALEIEVSPSRVDTILGEDEGISYPELTSGSDAPDMLGGGFSVTDGRHTIRVGNEGFATLGFWRKTDTTPFMCIEPWFPDSDLKKKAFFRDDKLNDLLPPGEEFKCQYYFELVK
jgi:hypothetical protein